MCSDAHIHIHIRLVTVLNSLILTAPILLFRCFGGTQQHRSGCGMWVDQKDLKLYITGADMPRIHAAARLVGDLISKAPVNVNSAGVEDEVRVVV